MKLKHLNETEATTKKEFVTVKVTGKTMYASVHTPKKNKFNPDEAPKYSLDLVVDEENAKILLDAGLKPAKVMIDEDTKKAKEYKEYPGQKVFTLRRSTLRKDGTEKPKLKVLDSQLQDIPVNVLIGNGSTIVASVNPYSVIIKGKEIKSHELLGIQVLDLVRYENHQDLGFEKTEGFTVNVAETKPTEKLSTKDESPFRDE